MFPRRKRRADRVAVRAGMVGLLVLAAGCGTDRDGSETALDEFYQQRVAWGSCAEFAGAQELTAAGMQCARIEVPIDYDRPGGDRARIALSRLAARGERVDSLVLQPGGPGQPGLDMPLLFEKAGLAERFDLIGIDVRGLGASTPTVECRTPEEARAERDQDDFDYTPAGIARTEQRRQELVARCVQRTGIELLAHVGTREVVRDLDIVRAALGGEKLSLYGGSYGSRVGSAYAETYPHRVRAMVLDAAVSMRTNLLDTVRASQSSQRAFDAYAADCTTAPTCPLGTDPAQATAALRALVNPLTEHPARTADPRGLSYRNALGAVVNSLYHPSMWPGLTHGLTELSQGRGDALLALTDSFETDLVDRDLQQAVLCLDERRVTDRAEAADIDHRRRLAAPFTDDGRATGAAALDVCAFWPVPPTWQPHVPQVSGLPPVVVVAATGDPVAPYDGAVTLAEDLNANLITYESPAHGGFGFGVPCIDEPVVRYLIELTPPAENLRCPAA
ncbi:alpha/beta hydrolase [Nocardia otitidiscaviarum]|uniref:alpha/beta hydrolase n=1 Tax=Nocardia otitidiscaviarum TaxID=1823 RepID=UPI0024550735|nr:alpha/beta hydrolase [Nocardia otitidiscaviarum]